MKEDKIINVDFDIYCRRRRDSTLQAMLESILKEQERRKLLKQLDASKLKLYLKSKYPFMFSKEQTNNKVAYRMAVCILLDTFKNDYTNINHAFLGRLIEKDRSTMYYYLESKECLDLPGFEFNKQAYEDVCKDMMAAIKKGEFDTPKNL